MENAIHKSTGKIVSAYKLTSSLEWIGKERDEFIAPYHEIGNWDYLNNKGIQEVKVSFVKKHNKIFNEQTFFVSPHFRIETDGAIENPNNESEEHKLAKEFIYDLAIEDSLTIEGKKLSEIGEVEDIRIECNCNIKRADVLVKFKNFHEIYGRGIAFEIQISPQKKEKTEERSYDRASFGYSIVWLWSGELKDVRFNIIPYTQARKDYQEQLNRQFNEKLWDLDTRANNKISDIELGIEKKLNSIRLQKDLLNSDIHKNLQQLKTIYDSVQDNLKEEVKKEIDIKIRNEIMEGIKSDAIHKYIETLYEGYLKDHNSYIKDIIEDSFLEQVQKRVSLIFQQYPIDKATLETNIHAFCQGFIKEINIKSIINQLIKSQEQVILQDLNSLADRKIQNAVDNKVNSLLSNELLHLKEESILNWGKSKLSYYFECPICKKDVHLINTSIAKQGDLFEIVCSTCKEKRDENKNKNQNT